MYTKELTYTDFNGVERTEVIRFNLTQAEVTQLQLTTKGGLDEYIKLITAEQDVPRIIELFKELVDLSYGVKSLDGKKFEKSEELLKDFQATQAYSDFYMSLLDVDNATAFVNGISPVEPQDHKAPAAKVTPINK